MGAAGRAKAEAGGTGRAWSSAWTRPTPRRSRPAAAKSTPMSRSILLVAYFYPPCRDTGALRPAAMAKYLRRLGHEVTVLTTSAYGELAGDAAEGVVRTADAQRWRARARGADRVDALYDSDTYAGRPHPLSRVIVPEPLVAGLGAVRPPRGAAPPPRAPLRRRDHHLAARVGPPGRPRPAPPRRRLGRGRSRRLDLRAASPPLPDRRAAPARRAARAPLARRRRPSRVRLRARGRGPAAARHRAAGRDPERLGPRPRPRTPTDEGTGLLDPERVSLVYTGRFGSYGRDPRALVEGAPPTRTRRPRGGRAARAGDRRPAHRGRGEAVRRRRRPGPDRRRRQPRARAGAGAAARGRRAAADRRSPPRSQLLNIKLFEYLASGRPILALAAGTEAGRIVGELGGASVRADDPEAIAAALRRARPPSRRDPPPASALAPYTYPAPAERMAEVVEDAIAAPR